MQGWLVVAGSCRVLHSIDGMSRISRLSSHQAFCLELGKLVFLLLPTISFLLLIDESYLLAMALSTYQSIAQYVI